jgi:hypothetical protein
MDSEAKPGALLKIPYAKSGSNFGEKRSIQQVRIWAACVRRTSESILRNQANFASLTLFKVSDW